MTSTRPFSNQSQSDAQPRVGFSESRSESMLQDWVQLAATFTGTSTALVLQDERGIWYRESCGLNTGQLTALESALSSGLPREQSVFQLLEHGLQVLKLLPLVDVYHRAMGTFCVLSAGPLELSATQWEGLRLVADHLQTYLTDDREQMESRTIPRAPSATSFVPGLAHELGSFIFGVSANLDAFEARFADLDDVSKYGASIRRSLDRMSAFIDELREYGDPQRFAWAERELEPILRTAIEHCQTLATQNQVQLGLEMERPLPRLNADEQSLRGAFIRLIDLALQQEGAGGRVLLHVESHALGERAFIRGHLDGPSLKLKNVDLARLFEPFYYRASGLGRLALPVARRVFESHGGNLAAGPGSEGGLRISFMLPAVLAYPLRPAHQP